MEEKNRQKGRLRREKKQSKEESEKKPEMAFWQVKKVIFFRWLKATCGQVDKSHLKGFLLLHSSELMLRLRELHRPFVAIPISNLF